MLLKRTAILAAALVMTAACGGIDDSSLTAEVSTAPVDEAVPTTEAFTTTPAAPSRYFDEPISFTTKAGWSYVLTPDVEGVLISFGKDFQESPPGKARLTSSTSAPASFGATVIPDTPGRKPPPLEAEVHVLVPLPEGIDTASAGACVSTNAFYQYQAEAYGLEPGALRGYVCRVNDRGSSSDLDEETVVDALLPIVGPLAAEPVILVNIKTLNYYGCGVLLFPDGTHLVGQPLSSGSCWSAAEQN